MPKSLMVEDFIAAAIDNGTVTIEQRDRLWRLAESGANGSTLLAYLRELGYQSSLPTVLRWKETRFAIGEKAREVNSWVRHARGLMPSDVLNQVAYWMLMELNNMFEELKGRDLSKVKTNQLLLIFATYSTKVQEAIVQAEKVRSLAECKDLIQATIEEARMTGRQILQTESPEMIAVIDKVLDTLSEKLDV